MIPTVWEGEVVPTVWGGEVVPTVWGGEVVPTCSLGRRSCSDIPGRRGFFRG